MYRKHVGRALILALMLSGATSMKAQKITRQFKNVPLKTVLAEVEKELKYSIIYKKDEVNERKQITHNFNDASLEDVLSAVLDDGLSYSVQGKMIVISKKDAAEPSVTQQKQILVKGVVKDENGEPVIGANVVEKGTDNGTVTGVEGDFSLRVASNAVLSISYIGFLPSETIVKDGRLISVILREDAEVLDEVVVVGYGTQKKANLSGAVETVTSKSLENRSTNNVALALQGLVPNLNVTPNGGQANAEPAFNIRGETSINGGSPLILVDGIPTSAADFGRMNAMDIENISVLKDASSAAIYGARASFGVILVTTKKGKGEKLTIQFNNNFNVRTLTNMPKVVKDPYIQASYKKEMGKPWYDLYTDEELEYTLKLKEDPSLPSTIPSTLNPNKWTHLATNDWFDTIFDKVGLSHQHNLNVSGATDKVSYYLGTEYYAESGMLHYNKDHYNRFNVRSKTEYRPFKWLTVGNNTALTYYKYDRPTNFSGWLYQIANETNSLIPVYNPDGSYTKEGAQMIGTLIDGGQSMTKS